MKRFLTTALVAATFFTGVACAADANIPWADNSGGTEHDPHCGDGPGSECPASAGDEDQ